MADGEGTGGGDGGKPQTDASDLKARLGLRTRTRSGANKPKLSPDQAAKLEAGGPEPSDQEVEAARQRAAAALDAEGTPIEAFDPLGQDRTPLPQALPGAGAPTISGGQEAKVKRGPLIVTLVLVFAVAMLLGTVLGGTLEQRDLRSAHARYAKEKLAYLNNAKTASGATVIDEIETFRQELKTLVSTIDAVEQQKDPDPLQLEGPLMSFVKGSLKRYVDDAVYVDASRIGDDMMVLYAEDELLAAYMYAAGTRQLFDRTKAAFDEAITYARMGQPAGSKVRSLLVTRTEREVEGAGKIPAAAGKWIADTGKPNKVKITDPRRPQEVREQWEMMVLAKGEKDAVQVPTTDVMQLDLTDVYANQAEAVRLRAVDRLATIVRELGKTAGRLKFDDVKTKLQGRAAAAD